MRLGVTDSQRLFHTVSGLEMLSGRILVSLLSFSLFAAVDTETGKILRCFFFCPVCIVTLGGKLLWLKQVFLCVCATTAVERVR